MKNTKKTEENAVIQDMLTKEAKERLAFLDAECRESSAYENFIDNLDCSAKIKRVLRELARKTANIGGQVLRVGKIALDFAIKVVREIHARFPHVTRAVLIVLILKALVLCVPLFGSFIWSLIAPLVWVTIVGIGAFKDLLDKVRPLAERHFNA